MDPVILGGSPGAGSSLLVNILNRHPAVMAGPETYLYIHPDLYQNWTSSREKLWHHSPWGGLKSVGWFQINGADLLQPFYGWTQGECQQLARASDSFYQFQEKYFSRALGSKSRWVEKSPSNVLAFDVFLDYFPEGKTVHTTRNPLDAVASLTARGYDPLYAAGAWLVNTAFALKVAESPRNTLLRYEDWVADPSLCLPAFFRFLDLEWSDSFLQPTEEERRQEVRMEGWLSNEKGPVRDVGIGRFEKLDQKARERILAALWRVRLTPTYQRRFGLPVGSIPEAAERLGYGALPPQKRGFGGRLWIWWQADRWRRRLRFYPSEILKNPL